MDEIREKIKRNFPTEAQSDAKRQKLLAWNRETATTIVSQCRTYRICRQFVKEDGAEGYFLTLCATPTAPNRHLSGPFLLPRDAREAAQRHADGIPLQADLS
jgi:hypothetical protein